MKAAVVIPKRKGTLHFAEVPMPRISGKGVLVRVIRVGLDGTDKEIGNGRYGKAPKGSKYLIVGHESLGVVEKVSTGAAKRGLKEGDYVVATVRRPDGCINCRAGESDMCLTGNYTERGINGAHGYMTEYYKETPENLVKIPKKIASAAVMLEPLSIAEKVVMQIFEIQRRMVWKPKTAVVLGTGTVGLFAAMLLRLKGLEVMSVDRTEHNPQKERIFRAMGIRHVNAKKTPVNELPKLSKKPIDIVVELTGNAEVVYDAMTIAGVNGIMALVSVTGGSLIMDIDVAKLNYGLVLGNRLVVGVVNSNRKHFLQGVRDMERIEGMHPGLMGSMITKRVRFGDFDDYGILDDRSQIKVVVEMESAQKAKDD